MSAEASRAAPIRPLRLRELPGLWWSLSLGAGAFGAAAALLSVHAVLVQHPALPATGLALLLASALVAAGETWFLRRRRATLPMPRLRWCLTVLVAGGIAAVPSVLTTLLAGAAVGALVAWSAGREAGPAAWKGVCAAGVFSALVLGYGAARLALFASTIRSPPPPPARPAAGASPS